MVFGPRSSGVEHFLGKEEVAGSNPVAGSRRAAKKLLKKVNNLVIYDKK
jgi:hypothetical protein